MRKAVPLWITSLVPIPRERWEYVINQSRLCCVCVLIENVFMPVCMHKPPALPLALPVTLALPNHWLLCVLLIKYNRYQLLLCKFLSYSWEQFKELVSNLGWVGGQEPECLTNSLPSLEPIYIQYTWTSSFKGLLQVSEKMKLECLQWGYPWDNSL